MNRHTAPSNRLARLAAFLTCGIALTVTSNAHGASLGKLPTPQGTTPGRTNVLAISGDGQVAGGSAENDNGDSGAVVWGYSGNLPSVGEFVVNSTTEGSVTSLSNNGLHYTLLDGVDDAVGSRNNGNFWLKNNLGTFAGFQEARGITDDGNVVVGRDAGRAAMWTFNPGLGNFNNAFYLPDLGGQFSGVFALTPDGTRAAGFAGDGSGTLRAVVWSGSGLGMIQSLDPTEAYGTSSGNAISDDGGTVVGYVNDGSRDIAAIWSVAGYGILDLVNPTGSTNSYAKVVNADGTIVGGAYETGSAANQSFAFLYANGQAGDLNTLLSNAGVDMTGIVLKEVTGLSDDGHYIATNSAASGFVAFYDGQIGGLTTGEAQVLSLDGVAGQRAALLIQPGAYESVLLGDLNAHDGTTELGTFGLYGSAAGGIRGTTSVGNLTINGGVVLGTGDYGSVAYDGGLAAGSLRYDLGSGTGLNPFVEAGGSFGRLQNVTFRRAYANGAGTAMGIGVTDGVIASTFARLGIVGDVTMDDEVTLLAEIGQHWLATSAYSEVQSAANPFPGSFSAATDASTSVEVAADWTHGFNDAADVTMRVAVGTTLGATSNLVASVTGSPGQTVAPVSGYYVDAGLRLGWNVTDAARIDLYAAGTGGERIGMAGHVGAGLTVGF